MNASKPDAVPPVTIVIPCRNEERFISRCLESILSGEYSHAALEILVVDGRSDDATRAILESFSARHPFIRMVDNPHRTTPHALNIGIRQARGDVVVRMDAHAEYPRNDVSDLVATLYSSGADNVGGLWETVPGADTPRATAIALALSHPLGVGNAYYRIGSTEPRWVDTVPFGCYRKQVFQKIGYFDEDLLRNQDDELNARLRKAGGRILLVPSVTCRYYARDTFGKVGRMFYQYGRFKPLAALKAGVMLQPRQLAPVSFVALVIALSLTAIALPSARLALAAVLGFYLSVTTVAAAWIGLSRGISCAIALAVAFPLLHFSYGFGMLVGALKLATPNRGITSEPVQLTR